MEVTKNNNPVERRILMGMIVDSTFLGRVTVKWEDQLFKSRWANLISRWCVKYYQEHQEAPREQIEVIFEQWAVKEKNESLIEAVETFLNSISKEYEELKGEINSDLTLDIAGKYFNEVKMERLMREVEDDISDGKVDQASSKILGYTQIEMGVGEGVNAFQDKEVMIDTFKEKQQPLVIYPGDVGEFLNQSLERDGFIAFMGPEKRGKSFWLLDVAFRAACQRKKVAFFDSGDNSLYQVMGRLLTRVARRPKYPKMVYCPTSISIDDEGVPDVNFKRKKFNHSLSWRESYRACKRLMRYKIKSKKPYLKISCHPNSTLSVTGIRDILQRWEVQEEWVPDVIVIDYVDILDMKAQGLEGRDLINNTWKQLRRLSQERHCLVVTATQTDATSYDAFLLAMKHFSEDKRKYAHVTGAIGLNQTDSEKTKGVMRLNWVVLREREFNRKKCVYVAGCLSLANPVICSSFRKSWKESEED